MATTLPVVKTGSFPPEYCFPNSWDLLLQAFAERLGVTLIADGWNVGTATPSADKRGKPWLRFLPADNSLDGVYIWRSGVWQRPHLIAPGSQERKIWVGTELELETYDGGSPAAVTDITGPMWEVDHNVDARFLLCSGTLPSGTEIQAGTTGGEEDHTLTKQELPEIFDGVKALFGRLDEGNNRSFVIEATGPDRVDIDPPEFGGEAHNNMPPYYGVWLIKRTGRRFYTVT